MAVISSFAFAVAERGSCAERPVRIVPAAIETSILLPRENHGVGIKGSPPKASAKAAGIRTRWGPDRPYFSSRKPEDCPSLRAQQDLARVTNRGGARPSRRGPSVLRPDGRQGTSFLPESARCVS